MAEAWIEVVRLGATALVSGGAGAGFWNWLSGRDQGKATVTTSQAAFLKALNEQQTAFTETLMEERETRETRIRQLEARIGQLEEENVECRGENRQLNQRIESLETMLERQGIDVKTAFAPGAALLMEHGRVTVLPTPAPAKRTRRRRDTQN